MQNAERRTQLADWRLGATYDVSAAEQIAAMEYLAWKCDLHGAQGASPAGDPRGPSPLEGTAVSFFPPAEDCDM